MFNAVLIENDSNGYRASISQVPVARLPEGDVTVSVHYSTLNYKDALAITGKGPIIRSFPMVPGIDFAGTVEHSQNPEFEPGDRVVLNGWGVGETHWGGLAQRARVKGDWLVKIPGGISSFDAMAIGTAGYTAMLSVIALERLGVSRSSGDVIVTGASGGVGSFSIMILAALGYTVVASTGKLADADYLRHLGATEIIDRETLGSPGKPLQKERWAAAIDTVGSHTLANICASTRADGVVAACGMVQGLDFPASVAPFILRGITLVGINSVTRPQEERKIAWRRLADMRDLLRLDEIATEVGLDSVLDKSSQLIKGNVRGRIVVDVNR